MQITFADNQTYELIVAKAKNEIIFSPEDMLSQGERDVFELHFDSTKYNMNELHKYFVNADEYAHTITLTDDVGASYVHTDYVIKLKYGMDYIGGEPNPRIILRLGQLTETDKSLREVAGKVKVYTGTETEIAIAKKLDELSVDCHDTIELGVDYNGSHYSLTEQDQTNILAWGNRASMGKSVPYHADGEFCRPYTAEEFSGLVDAAVGHIAHNTTYCNMLMNYTKTLTDISEINAIKYGVTELIGEYLDKYNENMALLTE